MRTASPARGEVEIWGGVECTVNRVEDSYADQCALNGHSTRPQDIELFASLGIRRIRYPVLWENVAPESLDQLDWRRPDERMALLRRYGLDPFIGLVHHGSGPRYTSLLDPNFPELLADYAQRVAERYSWATWYTPVNEPLTTARFSGLYGVWYPHHRNDASFVRALYHELKGTVLAMRAIRRVQPEARLLQTEDIGRMTGTERLQYQVDFENDRRWLTYDLLFGRVDERHPLRKYLTQKGSLTHAELDWFLENPCPPDIIGVNHYPLSNRFLDHRLDLYPEGFHGGNGKDHYADVGAVDSGQANPPTPEEVLSEVHERYHAPFAVTEAHIAGGREAQMRWLDEIWSSAVRLRSRGADIRAVTAWSLLGAYDWNSLCTLCAKHYESGVFDLRSPEPRPTALARMLSEYAAGGRTDHPVLARVGYWHSPERVLFAPPTKPLVAPPPLRPPRPILITGARGTLGRAFARVCERRSLDYILVSRQEMDIASDESVRACLERHKPWAVINTAGYVRVDDAEVDIDLCHRENTIGPEILARHCQDHEIALLTFSSDLVFDGEQRENPYVESDTIAPLNVYGRTKAEAEERVLRLNERALVVRTSSFFGPWDEHNFANVVLKQIRSGSAFEAAENITVSPTYVPDLVHTALDLLIDGLTGRIHLANNGALTWADWGSLIARKAGISPALVVARRSEDLPFRALRPRYSALSSERQSIMPHFEDAFDRFFREIEIV